MKKVFKKNQIVIAVLAVMIAAAGYLNRKNFWLEKQNSRDGKRDGK